MEMISMSVRRYAYLAIASLQSFFISGIIYGWPSMVLILKDEGVFAGLCDDDDVDSNERCSAQDIRMSSIFTAGTCALLSSLFIMGLFLDRFGPRASCMAGCAFVALGSFLFGLSYSVDVDFYLIGFGLIAFGGPAVHTSFIHLSNLFPTQKPLIISLFNGVFSLSGYVYLLFRWVYELSDGDIGIAYLSYGHAILVIGFLLMSWLWPSTAFEMEPVSRKEDSTDATAGEEKSAAVGEVVPISSKATPHEEYREKLRHLGIVEQFKAAREIEQCKYSELSFGQQMLTVEFVLNVVFMSVNILGLQFYIGTASEQLLVLGDVDSTYTVLANLITPLGALGIPLYGWMLNRSFAISFFCINSLGMMMNACAMIDVLPLQVVTFCLWAVYRTWLFSAAYAFVAFFFGFRNFGKVNGITLATAGAVSLSQLLLSMLSAKLFSGEFFWLNAAFIGARVPLLVIVAWLWRRRV